MKELVLWFYSAVGLPVVYMALSFADERASDPAFAGAMIGGAFVLVLCGLNSILE